MLREPARFDQRDHVQNDRDAEGDQCRAENGGALRRATWTVWKSPTAYSATAARSQKTLMSCIKFQYIVQGCRRSNREHRLTRVVADTREYDNGVLASSG